MTPWCSSPAASITATTRRRSCARRCTPGTTRCAWGRSPLARNAIGCRGFARVPPRGPGTQRNGHAAALNPSVEAPGWSPPSAATGRWPGRNRCAVAEPSARRSRSAPSKPATHCRPRRTRSRCALPLLRNVPPRGTAQSRSALRARLDLEQSAARDRVVTAATADAPARRPVVIKIPGGRRHPPGPAAVHAEWDDGLGEPAGTRRGHRSPSRRGRVGRAVGRLLSCGCDCQEAGEAAAPRKDPRKAGRRPPTRRRRRARRRDLARPARDPQRLWTWP